MSEELAFVDTGATQPTSKVTITVTGCSVVIEAAEPMDKVADRALALHREVNEPGTDRPGPAVGFTSERRWSRHQDAPGVHVEGKAAEL